MAVVPRRTTVVWLALCLVTVASFWVSTGHTGASTKATAGAVVALGFAKAFLVGRHFMEIREAPLPLRAAFALWTGLFGTLCVFFVLS